jgi:hypothetical protein
MKVMMIRNAQTNADVLSAKKRRLAMLHDIIANASKM